MIQVQFLNPVQEGGIDRKSITRDTRDVDDILERHIELRGVFHERRRDRPVSEQVRKAQSNDGSI